MRVQYCSDLHLEFGDNASFLNFNYLKVVGEVLILAGDIAPLHDEFFNCSFFRFISKNFKQVFWVPGNHEYYYRDISDFETSFNIKICDNINIVNNIMLQYGDINFIFSTMWSKISKKNEKYIEQNVSDFDCIIKNTKKFKVSDFNKLHDESLNFIKQAITGRKDKIVVVTHHVPLFSCNSSVHNDSIINEAFNVNLSDYIEKSNINFWIYGHSHFNQSPVFIGKTIMLTNQLGYIQLNEQDGFKNNAYFSL